MNRSPDVAGKRINMKTVAIFTAFAVVTLPSLYVLSMGPMLWLSTHGFFSNGTRQFLSRLYEPLWILASYVPFLKELLHWYMSFWDN